MPKLTVKIAGLKELEKKLGKDIAMTLVKDTVKINTEEMKEKMSHNAGEFRGHYEGNRFVMPTGRTLGSIDHSFEDNGLTGEAGARTEYAPYVNYGTRFMSAQPFVTDAFNAQKEQFKRDMQKLVR